MTGGAQPDVTSGVAYFDTAFILKCYAPEPGSAEARLADYLRPRNWLTELA